MYVDFDVVVVGGGHAGCEAALASARMGMHTALLTIDPDTVARMSCNPAIGGLAKGQLVREIDALGGEMAKVIDQTGIQFRMLNTSKGPAVRSPRAQADKKPYQLTMKRRLEEQENLSLCQETVDALLVKHNRVIGIIAQSGITYRAKAVILTTGTFLKGLIHCGNTKVVGGRVGEPSAEKLSSSLISLGFELGRLKTGTPPRLNGQTINYDVLKPQYGDKNPQPFSYSTDKIVRPQVPCYITYTNQKTHEILRANLNRAPLYTGQIKAVGPRYCPSIEDKIVRFPDKDQHQIFLEPEGLDTLEVYCNGISTSVPQDVQEAMVHSIKGLEDAEFVRHGYAIEYDFVPPTHVKPSLETKLVENLFFAGQINGTSGYEEAAAQGIMAGINAVLRIRGEESFVLDRSEAYIGVLIDDLVTKGTHEPYRMFTSRAEYRLLLRQDNADRRLMKYGHRYGLIKDNQWERLKEKEKAIAEVKDYIRKKYTPPSPLPSNKRGLRGVLRGEKGEKGEKLEIRRSLGGGACTLEKLLRRPEINFADLLELDDGLKQMVKSPTPNSATPCRHGMELRAPNSSVQEQVEIEVKYEGYIERQQAQVEKFKKMEGFILPSRLKYSSIPELRTEARQKLEHIRPLSLGQASRISGISPADLSILMIYLNGKRKNIEN
ncbi:MAG: tRNA uridine-5-carboxymethylaminomethyl(34) synthesis enzyme MnmG [Candidatus Brocadiales bacterium]